MNNALHATKHKHCLVFSQALLIADQRSENQAMLTTTGPALGARLKAAIEAAGVSVSTVAAACDRSTAAVYGWFKTGRVHKQHLPVIAKLTNRTVDQLLSDGSLVPVETAKKTEVIEVELPREAIDLARSWLVLPENERNEFRRKIETAALRYRDHVSDARMRAWGKEQAPATRKPPKSDPHSN